MSKEQNHIRLSELNTLIRECIQDNFTHHFWVVAEIGDIKFNRNGHAYLELIEKDQAGDKIVARANANIWSYTLRMLKPYFETTTGRELQAGLRVLVSVSVEFHEIYGFSLNVKDIDPAYTLGDIEMRRLEIIRQLTEDGVFSMNKELELPLVIQNIAIISSDTAAGFQDFMQHLLKNPGGYKFNCRLFPAMMQGEQTEPGIISALASIYESEDQFDIVVIIRGGGSRSDLMWFDNYNLAYHITQFPLPVISGIGHEKDVSIVDMVSHTSLKTPTAVAEFLVSAMEGFEEILDEYSERMLSYCTDFLEAEYERIESLGNLLIPIVQKRLHYENTRIELNAQKISLLAKSVVENQSVLCERWLSDLKRLSKSGLKWRGKELEQYQQKICSFTRNYLQIQHKKLEFLESSIGHFHPENVLRKGYSITKYQGKILTNAAMLENGESVETILYQGKFTSKVEKE